MKNLDDVDLTILELLQRDGRLSKSKLAEMLGISEAACWRRVKRLEDEQYILGYQAIVNRAKLDLDVVAFVQVRLSNHTGIEPRDFERAVIDEPRIMGAHNITGATDYLLHVVDRSLSSYGTFVAERLRQFPGVRSMNSFLMLRRIKYSRVLTKAMIRGEE